MNPIAASRALVLDGFASADRWSSNVAAAESLLWTVLEASPEDMTALTSMGAVLCDQAKYSEAVELLKRAVQLGSTDRNTHYNLGVALVGCATPKEAMAAFERARSFNASPETWAAYFDPQAQ
jgi:predicted Zn-dependent protease